MIHRHHEEKQAQPAAGRIFHAVFSGVNFFIDDIFLEDGEKHVRRKKLANRLSLGNLDMNTQGWGACLIRCVVEVCQRTWANN